MSEAALFPYASKHPVLKQWLLVILLAMFVMSTQIATLRPGHDWGDDFAQYIQQARNLAEGRPMLENTYIYNPHFASIGPRGYPPGFPLLLAPVVKVAGTDLRPMKTIGIISFGLALLAIFHLLFRILPFGYCLAMIAALGFNPFLWGSKDSITSDVPFLFLLYVALTLIEEARARQWQGTGLMIAAGVSIYASFATRTVGGILLPVLAVYFLIRFRRFRHVPLGAWIILLTAGFLIAIHFAVTLQESLSYADSVSQQRTAVFHAMHSNVLMYVWTLHYLFFPAWGGRVLSVLFCGALGALCIWGYASRLRSGPTILEIFTLFYSVVILLVPWGSGRYLIPLIPLALLYIVCAIRSLPGDGKWNIRTITGVVVTASIASSCLTDYAARNGGVIKESFGNSDFMSACSFLRRDTPVEATVICKKPRLSTLITGRRSSVYDPAASDKQQLKWFRACRARYVLTSPEFPDDRTILQPFLGRHRQLFHLAFRSGDFEIYRIEAN